MDEESRAICDYEGSDYQTRFWDQGGREYEHRVEQIALRRLLPPGGKVLLEIGAGAGRNTANYHGYERVVLLDYARSQLEQARQRLGTSERYVYVVATAYELPFAPAAFEAATMIRTLHHLTEPERAFRQIGEVLAREGVFILEYANKRNLKAIARWLLRRQRWNPFDLEAVEFAPLNFDFHPRMIRTGLIEAGFTPRRHLTVSHFRAARLKRILPLALLVGLDSLLQWTGVLWQLTPSVFVRAGHTEGEVFQSENFWRCVECGSLELSSIDWGLHCGSCGSNWALRDGIYEFKQPLDG